MAGRDSDRVGETARRAGIATFAVVLLAAGVLVTAAFQDNFSIAYIFQHSNRDLPAPYKFAVLWSGQEGSLLFWSLLLAAYGLVLRLRHKVDSRLFAYASVVIAAVQVFFLLLLNFAARPFALTQGAVPADGAGSEPAAAISRDGHPPAHAVSRLRGLHRAVCVCPRRPGDALPGGEVDSYHPTLDDGDLGVFDLRSLSRSALGLPGARLGRLLGMDPVENVSLLPWLTGTAFLHSVMMQEKRGMLKVWNMWLIFVTFMLCIFGTFLTRSGVISSVHAFAQSSIGNSFLTFLSLFSGSACFSSSRTSSHLRSEHKLESLASRESSLLFQ